MPIVAITPRALALFTGSERMFYHPLFRSINYTEGVKYVSDNEAAWLVTDILAVVTGLPKVKREEFVVAELVVHADKSATVTYTDGNEKKLHKQDYPITNFPLSDIKFFITDNVMMLPSEY